MWKERVANGEGNFINKEKEKMFIPHQTYVGLQITVKSVVVVTRYLLKTGSKFVLTERLNQDILEEHFGRQRNVGCRNDAPNLSQFGYNSDTIRIQRSVVPVRGNTIGAPQLTSSG